MAEPIRSSPSASAFASSSSSYREDSGAAASSSGTSSQVHEEEEQHHEYPHQHHFHNPELENQHLDLVSYTGNLSGFDDSSAVIGDDTWSCIIVVLTFWFFGSYLFPFPFTFLVNLSFFTIITISKVKLLS